MELQSGKLFRKEIFCVSDGRCLGTADELLLAFDDQPPREEPSREEPLLPGGVSDAAVLALVIRGRPRLLGLLGREADIQVNWADILVIGDDAILIRGNGSEISPGRGGSQGRLRRFFQR